MLELVVAAGFLEKIEITIEEHENHTEQHLQMAIDTVSELKAKQVDQYASVIILKNFEQLRIGDQSQYSTPFYTNPGGYKMCLLVHANGC
ncbi:MAG: hypothetical protein MJE68_27915, partial [Proteobacteria bacterium]|nr:hypothetical protein [Pseudomonadota bacterium]